MGLGSGLDRSVGIHVLVSQRFGKELQRPDPNSGDDQGHRHTTHAEKKLRHAGGIGRYLAANAIMESRLQDRLAREDGHGEGLTPDDDLTTLINVSNSKVPANQHSTGHFPYEAWM